MKPRFDETGKETDSGVISRSDGQEKEIGSRAISQPGEHNG